MISRAFLGLAVACTVVLFGAVVMATAIPDRPSPHTCVAGSILTHTTDCRVAP
ncbi:hypothetical protein [Bradyrhizobium sp. SRS-191]|uniref:hypothetical protein n=1 Tax=Bradyrhizobium sp. SRS-191 TaxID=2962606 RepID=UPI00211F077F|nr:hypothetical protein [Bradyrhizobium sp. SRS-191]